MKIGTRIALPNPDAQVDFAHALVQIRKRLLQEALFETVAALLVAEIDDELARFAPALALSLLASKGLRGELAFAIPVVLRTSPQLLGYYRLLLGFSQKSFYSRDSGLLSFKSMEERGVLTPSNELRLDELCTELARSAALLIEGINHEHLTKSLMDDLALLTLGPQLRGGANVRKGAASTLAVFEILHSIVRHSTATAGPRAIVLVNAAGRKVFIEFAADPDITIQEELSINERRNIIAIEVKGGTDFSNIHNRIGEAEKSHQKARSKGFVECWTVVNVRQFDAQTAARESPSTNRFYCLTDLENEGPVFDDFRKRVLGLTGVPEA
jgi:hypothetical protein